MAATNARGYARQILGAALVSASACDLLDKLTAHDFHGIGDSTTSELMIAEAIRALHGKGEPVDTVTVSAEMDRRGTLRRVGGSVAVHELHSELMTATNAEYYAGLLRGETRRRMMLESAERIAAMLRTDGAVVDEVAAVRDEMENKIPGALDDTARDYTLATFMQSVDEAEDWIIPGLLARGERIVVTGGEGLGKGVLLRQLAASVASGWHPFGAGKFTPGRVVFMDLENPRRAIKETFYLCHRALNWDYGNTIMRYRPEGIDLLGSDLAWAHQVLADARPDVLVISPAYKAIGDADENENRTISRLLRRFDDLRTRHGCALIVEHHSPNEQAGQKRPVRPIGASVWRRWCDVGIGIRPHDMSDADEADKYIAETEPRPSWMDVVRWKPSRGLRDWPIQLRYGKRNELPWQPAATYNPKLGEVA